MTDAWLLGFFVGLFVVLIVALIVSAVKFRTKEAPAYDERQLIARNNAYKTSFFTLLAYCGICAVLDLFDIKWAILYAQMFLGILLSATVFVVICITKDAYVGFNEKNANTYYILLGITGFTNGAVFFFKLLDGDAFLTDGMLNGNIMQPALCVFFAITIIAHVVWRVRNKREVEEE